jgi:hypothetical protein
LTQRKDAGIDILVILPPVTVVVRARGGRNHQTPGHCFSMTRTHLLIPLIVVAAAVWNGIVAAQQLVQPDGRPGQVPTQCERLPVVWNEPYQPEPVYRTADGRREWSGYLKAPTPETIAAPEPPVTPLTESDLDDAKMVDIEVTQTETEVKYVSGLSEFWGYRYNAPSTDFIIGHGNQFGMFSLNGDHYQAAGSKSGVGFGLDFNFVSGPTDTEMPPRLYDFSIAYQCRRHFGLFGYDVAASVMASSDFEGSAREGIRYPGHAVGFLRVSPTAELVFGIDYLDRGDYKLLPVAGMIWNPNENVRLELVFPRPRATFALPPQPWFDWLHPSEPCWLDHLVDNSQQKRFYVGGELGGGTWAVERGGMHDDLATYRDLRLNLGLECVDPDGSRSAFEVSYLFERRLEFTSGNGDMRLDDTIMIRLISNY